MRTAHERLPSDIANFALLKTAGASDDRSRIIALTTAFTESEFRLDTSPAAPGGNGLYRIMRLLEDKSGTSEQYASAFAVLCRSLGWDARVVLGFHPEWNANGFRAEGTDIAVWVEVRFTGIGWVTVDPAPARTTDGQTVTSEQDAVGSAAKSQRTDLPPEVPGPSPSSTVPRPNTDDSSALPAILASVAAIVVLLLLAAPTARTIRRQRRRRAATARARASGAWREAVDALIESRVDVPRTGTTCAVTAAAHELADLDMRELSALVDHAVYGPEPPSPAHVDHTWRASDHIRSQARRRHPPVKRIVHTFNPWTVGRSGLFALVRGRLGVVPTRRTPP